jgi:hypothetical protein
VREDLLLVRFVASPEEVRLAIERIPLLPGLLEQRLLPLLLLQEPLLALLAVAQFLGRFPADLFDELVDVTGRGHRGPGRHDGEHRQQHEVPRLHGSSPALATIPAAGAGTGSGTRSGGNCLRAILRPRSRSSRKRASMDCHSPAVGFQKPSSEPSSDR